jgi:hypothetical protein
MRLESRTAFALSKEFEHLSVTDTSSYVSKLQIGMRDNRRAVAD